MKNFQNLHVIVEGRRLVFNADVPLLRHDAHVILSGAGGGGGGGGGEGG